MKYILTIALAVLATLRAAYAAIPSLELRHVHPQPTGQWLTTVAWGPPGFVAVGWEGEILFSTNSNDWERILPRTTRANLSAVCHYDGRYVAVGAEGVALWSLDGRQWQAANTGVQSYLRTCHGAGGRYVTAGWDKTLLVSTNGIAWQKLQAPDSFTDITFGNDRWVAVNGPIIYTSTNLVDWRSQPLDFPYPILNTVCFGSGIFVVGGARSRDSPSGVQHGSLIRFSRDAEKWEHVTFDESALGEIKDCTFADGSFVAVKGNDMLRSTNGVSWSLQSNIAPFRRTLNGVAGDAGGKWVAVGERGEIIISEDGYNWQRHSTEPREYLNHIAHAGGRFVAVGGKEAFIGESGSSAVLSSTNGVKWQASLTNLSAQLRAVTYGQGTWVAMGQRGQVFTSRDAANWTDCSLADAHAYPTLYSVAYGNGRFVASAPFRNRLFYSTNACDWVGFDGPSLSDLRYLNGGFVAADDAGRMMFSPDGLNWEARQTPAPSSIGPVTYGKGRYIAGGLEFVVMSRDGVTWQVVTVPQSVYDLAYVSGWFIAVGAGTANVIASRDGLSWSPVPVADVDGFWLEDIAVDGERLYVTSGLSILQGTLADPEGFRRQLHLLGTDQLEFWGDLGFNYRLEESEDLNRWSPAPEWVQGGGDWLLWDIHPPATGTCFWRIASRPTADR